MARLSQLVETLKKVLENYGDYKVFLTTDGILHDKVCVEWDDNTKEVWLMDRTSEEK